jgi:hypothetical protein
MKRVLLLALTLVAAPAAAQSAAEKPAAPAPEQANRERPVLNLRLDNPSSYATTSSPEKEPAKGLPTLGGDARPIAPRGTSGPRPESGGPFPKDTNPNL